MKIGGIYLKSLVAFILVQVLAMLTMVSLVKMGKIRPPFLHHAEERAEAARHLVERELAGKDSIPPELRERLDFMLDAFASSFNGRAWLTDASGTVISSSTSLGKPLSGDEVVDEEERTGSGDMLYLLERGDHKNVYVVGAIPFRNAPLHIHILHQWMKQKEETWFLEGLLLMSGIAALLLLPVTRKLTRPLKKLTQAAEQVASGDFSPRVRIKRGGELSVLADSFNHMAESVERMVLSSRELTANLSHELRSPLARIRISQQIIQERVASGRIDGIEKHVGKMEAEIDHMDGLIGEILQLSKLDLQEKPAHDDLAAVDQLVAEAVSRHKLLMDGKGMTAAVGISPMPPLRCNRSGIVRVLDNVLANAIKYGPEGGVISIAAAHDGQAAVITVSNPYPPVSPEELETIFVPFKRLGYDEVEGSGLGLAFARKIVAEHGGSITAESGDNVFRIRLRLP